VLADIDGAALSDLAALCALKPESLPLVESGVRLAEPAARVGKFVCVGLNYADHAAESGMASPSEPILFLKANSAIMGPHDDVVLPPASKKGDWEVELGVVIGREARYVSKERRWSMSPASVSSTICLNGSISSKGWASGTRARARARAAIPSARSVLISSRWTKFRICRRWACGSTSMASACRPDQPPA